MKFTVRGMRALAEALPHPLPDSLVIPDDVGGVHHHDVVVGQEVEGRGILGAGQEREGAGFGDPAEGVADRVEVASLADAARHLEGRAVPGQGVQARIVAPADGGREIVVAQVFRHGSRHLGGRAHPRDGGERGLRLRHEEVDLLRRRELRAGRDDARRGAPDPLGHGLPPRGLPSRDPEGAADVA